MKLAIQACVAAVLLLVPAGFLLLDSPGMEDLAPTLAADLSAPLPPDLAPPETAGVETQPLAATSTTLPPGPCRLRGVVRDPAGAPAAHSEVTIQLVGGPLLKGKKKRARHVVKVRTNDDGRFVFDRLPVGTWRVDASRRPVSLEAPVLQELTDEAREAALELHLHPGLALLGTVTDTAGRPVKGAEVELRARSRKKHPRDPIHERFATTGRDGRFRFRGLRARSAWRIAARHEAFYQRKKKLAVTMEAERELDLRMVPFAALSGIVRDPSGTPLGNVAVELAGFPEVRSDTSGAFAITHVMPTGKPMELMAASDDLAWLGRSELTLAEGEQRAGFVLEMQPAGRIEGRVGDVDDLGIAGATVTARRPGAAPHLAGRGSVLDLGLVDSSGRAALQRLSFLGAGGSNEPGSTSLSFKGSLVLNSNRADALTSKWIAAGLEAAEPDRQRVQRLAEVITYEAARKQVAAAERDVLLGPALRESEGGIRDHSEAMDRSTRITFKGIEALNLGDLRVNLLGVNGALIRGSSPTILHVNPRITKPAQTLRARLVRARSAVTDEDGRYVIGGLWPAAYQVSARAAGFLDSAKRRRVELHGFGDRQRADHVLHRGGQLLLRFTRADEGTDGKVRCELRNLRNHPWQRRVATWGTPIKFNDLAAGRYVLTARLEDAQDDLVSEVTRLVVELDQARQVHDLHLVPGALVTGSVLDGQGRPLEKASVKVTSRDGFGTSKLRTDASGSFMARGLLAGRYRVMVTAKGCEAAKPRDIVLRRQGHAVEDFTLARVVRVSGSVVLPSGVSPKGIHVFAHIDGRSWNVSTNARGDFTFKSLPAKPALLYARSNDYTLNGRTEADLGLAQQRSGLQITLSPALQVSGRVVGASGAGLPNVTVRAQATDNPRVKRKGRTGRDGSFVIKNLYEGPYSVFVPGRASPREQVHVQLGGRVPHLELQLRK